MDRIQYHGMASTYPADGGSRFLPKHRYPLTTLHCAKQQTAVLLAFKHNQSLIAHSGIAMSFSVLSLYIHWLSILFASGMFPWTMDEIRVLR